MKTLNRTKRLCLAAVLCAYPVAILLMGQSAGEIAFYAYIIPFFISTAGGAILSGIVLGILNRTDILTKIGLREA